MGKESEKAGICVQVKLNHFTVQLKLTALQTNYTPINISFKEDKGTRSTKKS